MFTSAHPVSSSHAPKSTFLLNSLSEQPAPCTASTTSQRPGLQARPLFWPPSLYCHLLPDNTHMCTSPWPGMFCLRLPHQANTMHTALLAGGRPHPSLSRVTSVPTSLSSSTSAPFPGLTSVPLPTPGLYVAGASPALAGTTATNKPMYTHKQQPQPRLNAQHSAGAHQLCEWIPSSSLHPLQPQSQCSHRRLQGANYQISEAPLQQRLRKMWVLFSDSPRATPKQSDSCSGQSGMTPPVPCLVSILQNNVLLPLGHRCPPSPSSLVGMTHLNISKVTAAPGPGSDLCVQETVHGSLGTLICYTSSVKKTYSFPHTECLQLQLAQNMQNALRPAGHGSAVQLDLGSRR